MLEEQRGRWGLWGPFPLPPPGHLEGKSSNKLSLVTVWTLGNKPTGPGRLVTRAGCHWSSPSVLPGAPPVLRRASDEEREGESRIWWT